MIDINQEIDITKRLMSTCKLKGVKGYAIIKYDKDKLHTILFDDFVQFKRMMQKQVFYDYFDNAQKLKDNEKVLHVYFANKIILL